MIRIAEFEPIVSASGTVYRPKVYGDPHPAGWDGYVVFFPLAIGNVISTPRETTQLTLESLERWALAHDRVYLDGALVRALNACTGARRPSSAADLAAAEVGGAADAIALRRPSVFVGATAPAALAAAELEEMAARADDAAAAAREAANAIRDEEDVLAIDEVPESEAGLHEPRRARAAAADTPKKHTKRSRAAKHRRAKRRE